MPELPEVEAERRFCTKVAVDRTIERVNALEQGGGPRDGLFDDKIIAEGVTEEAFVQALVGRRRRAPQRQIALVGIGQRLVAGAQRHQTYSGTCKSPEFLNHDAWPQISEACRRGASHPKWNDG